MVGIYGSSELAVLATQFATGCDVPSVTIDADRVGLDMPSDLTLIPHMKLETNDTLLGGRIMEYLHGQKRDILALIFCDGPTHQTHRTLQRTCQHLSILLSPPDAYAYTVMHGPQGREIHYALQHRSSDVHQMLNWVRDHRVMSRVTCIDIQDGTKLFERLTAMDFEGFLVVTI